MRYIRENAQAMEIDPHMVAAMGFSAGGHLAATAGTMWNDPVLQEKLGAKNGACTCRDGASGCPGTVLSRGGELGQDP